MKYDEKTGYLTLPGLREAVRIGEWGTIEGATGWSRIATDEEEAMYNALRNMCVAAPHQEEARASIERGLQQSQAGDTHYLGSFADGEPSAPSVLRGPSALAPEILMCVGCGWDSREPIRDAKHPNALACCPDHDFRSLPAAARYARDLVPDARDMVNGWILDVLKAEPFSGSPERAEGPQ